MSINYEGFKNLLIEGLSNYEVELIVGLWDLRVQLDKENYYCVDLKSPWDKFLQTADPEVLHNFLKTQVEVVEWLIKNDYSYATVKDKMIYAVRSSEQLKKLNSKEAIISEQLGEDLYGVVILDHSRFTEYFNRHQITDAPSIEQVIEDAKENTLKKGWAQETQTQVGEQFEILSFDDHISHLQFFQPSWLERKIGDCFITFPTNRVALVLKYESSIDWKDKVEGFDKLTKAMEECVSKSNLPLSNTIVHFSNNKYKFMSKI